MIVEDNIQNNRLKPVSSEKKRDDRGRMKAYRNQRSPEKVLRQRETDRTRKQNMKNAQSATEIFDETDDSLKTADEVGGNDLDMVSLNDQNDNPGKY